MVAVVGLVARIERMDSNPYASPISAPESQDASPPQRPANPYVLAALFGVDTWLGLGVSFVFVWQALEAQGWLSEVPLDVLFWCRGDCGSTVRDSGRSVAIAQPHVEMAVLRGKHGWIYAVRFGADWRTLLWNELSIASAGT